MNLKIRMGIAIALATTMVAPTMASAFPVGLQTDRRQQTKNEWRNIAIASGVLGALGLIKGDKTLFFAGAAGALYSTYRYEQDRKSQSKADRARAAYFSKKSFVRDGVRYDRRLVTKNGKKFYQFVRHTPAKK